VVKTKTVTRACRMANETSQKTRMRYILERTSHRGRVVVLMLSMDLWVKKGAGQQLTEEVLETSRTAAHHRDATVTTDVQREVVVLRCYSVSWTRSGGVFHG